MIFMWDFVATDRARKHLEALERKEQLSRKPGSRLRRGDW